MVSSFDLGYFTNVCVVGTIELVPYIQSCSSLAYNTCNYYRC